ncbi:MAG: trigger factor [Thermogutta sp.]
MVASDGFRQDDEELKQASGLSEVEDADLMAPAATDESAGEAEESTETPLEFEFDVEAAGPCKRKIIVTIPRKEVDRYFQEEFDKIRDEAQVPGFRPGRAPRKLLEKRYRNELREPVKARLMLDAFTALADRANLAPISDPDLDPDRIELPDEGDFAFEFSVEVRPEFEIPNWKGLKLTKTVYSYTPQYFEAYLREQLKSEALLEEVEEPAQLGDYITCDISLFHEGRVLNSSDGERLLIRPRLTFMDGVIEDFGERMVGVQRGESRTCDVRVAESCSDPELAGKTIQVRFKVHAVLRRRSAENLEAFAQTMGYGSVEELRDAYERRLRSRLDQMTYESLRKQILDQLLDVVPFDLPQDLVKRQTERELRRRAVELVRAGYSQEDIQPHLNAIAREARTQVVRLLREHFLLERLAEAENIEADEDAIDAEVERIAMQTGRSPRQVRAELDQEEAWDVIRNAIVERRMIEKIIEVAEITEEQKTLTAREEAEETALDLGVVRPKPSAEETSD